MRRVRQLRSAVVDERRRVAQHDQPQRLALGRAGPGQGGVGYLQYALGIPASLVSLHLLGACLVWVGALRVGVATTGAR